MNGAKSHRKSEKIAKFFRLASPSSPASQSASQPASQPASQKTFKTPYNKHSKTYQNHKQTNLPAVNASPANQPSTSTNQSSSANPYSSVKPFDLRVAQTAETIWCLRMV